MEQAPQALRQQIDSGGSKYVSAESRNGEIESGNCSSTQVRLEYDDDRVQKNHGHAYGQEVCKHLVTSPEIQEGKHLKTGNTFMKNFHGTTIDGIIAADMQK